MGYILYIALLQPAGIILENWCSGVVITMFLVLIALHVIMIFVFWLIPRYVFEF